MAQRKYDNATLAGLMTLCRGYCYWPGCTSRVIAMVNGVPKLNAEIAHIRAINPGGKRFDPKWSEPERNSFKNLLLLCVPHHTTIDGASSGDYPVELLEEWKASREGESVEALDGLTGLTEARLSEMLAEAQGEFLDQVRPALAEFSKTAPELAGLLNTLLDELADPRIHGFGVSPDAIELFSDAARSLGSFEDNVGLFASAADSLGNLEDRALLLMKTAQRLETAAAAIQSAIADMPRGRW
ncbi:hypothetical protein STAFG_8419 [Streptomyces afghaniensis 772]|uniref:Uncharacterized protein n=1 Tax=Streptomyces afghaniensis 772 TaxID=1283301 RepID=S4MDP8_9ACTN|nr:MULTISPECIES: hypothetical protein [Streptomyces]EPJ34516.1 hypothetical protein STAFG_8419 [Streptomyces afghaniensis 772]UOB12683.1 hypothetical protein MQE23_28135 [Streptomyces sp. HP-A2021]